MPTITYKTLKLIKNLVFWLAILGSTAHGKELYRMKNHNGDTVTLDLALTQSQHAQGLSGLTSKQFSNSRGMLFVNSGMGPRKFWMPNTFFNLDIIFLDSSLKIVGIEKNVPAHPGSIEPPVIYKTNTYMAHYVLETKASSSFGKKLKIADQLKFIGTTSLSEIGSSIHLKQ
jgi:hypothetical protein